MMAHIIINAVMCPFCFLPACRESNQQGNTLSVCFSIWFSIIEKNLKPIACSFHASLFASCIYVSQYNPYSTRTESLTPQELPGEARKPAHRQNHAGVPLHHDAEPEADTCFVSFMGSADCSNTWSLWGVQIVLKDLNLIASC